MAQAGTVTGAQPEIEDELHQFQRKLYSRMDEAADQEGRSLLISFRTGGRRYALEGRDVERVSAEHGRIVGLPNSKPWFRGVVNLAGEIVSVVDLAVLAKGNPVRTDNAILIAVVNQYDTGCAFLAEEVENTTTVDDLAAPVVDNTYPWLPEYYPGTSPLYRLDLATLFSLDWFKDAFVKETSE